MRELYQCHECGFLSTVRKAFNLVHNELHCEYCDSKGHSEQTIFKAPNNDYTKLPKVKDPELSKCIKNIQVAIRKLGNFA